MPQSKPRPHITSAVAVLALIGNLVSTALPAGATVRNWNNAAGGSAGTSTNWTPNGVPGVADNLGFSLANTYTVDFPASAGQVVSQVFKGGFVTLTTSSPHVCTTSWSVGSFGTGTLALSGANVKAGGLYLGVSSSDYGHMTITSSGGLPPTSSRFETTDTSLTQTALIAGDGKARLEVFGGSQLLIGRDLTLANTAAARCTLTVAGRNNFAFTSSMVSLTNPRFGHFQGGLSGQAVINISNGGYFHVASQASLGGQNTGVGNMTVSGTTFGASAYFDGPLYVGGNQFGGTAGGTGSLLVGNRGYVNVAGPIQVGDPDGGGTSGLTLTGGELVAAGGLAIRDNGNFTPAGGIAAIIGGTFTPKPNGVFAIGSGGSSDAPEVWVSNHQANTYVSYFDGISIGSVSTATLRVTGSATTFGTTASAPVSVSTLSATPAKLVVDSLGTFEDGGYLDIGDGFGKGAVTVAGGSILRAKQTFVGNNNNSTGLMTVKDPGSQMQYTDRLAVGGTTSASGSSATMLADSGATVSGVVADSASTVVVVQTPQGHLTVAHGGTIGAGTVRVLGSADVDAGTYSTGLVSVLGTGSFGGHGLATGNVTSTGTTHAVLAAPGVFGALRVNGAYSQGAGAKLRLRLGTTGVTPVNDSLVVTGNAGLNGVLALEADPGFHRTVGDSFTVVTYGSRLGTFSALTWNGTFAGQLFDLVYEPHKLVAVVKAANVGVGDAAPTALRFSVLGNVTRPELALDLPVSADVRIDLYDVNGRRAAGVHDGSLGAGRHTFALDAARHGISPGVYFASAIVGGVKVQTLRIVMLR